MFFSKDILARKQQDGSLSVVWLAATLGPKNQTKKLSKRDYERVNVVETCDFLVRPPEPMALRLSSNLMVGITRVYGQQYQFYLHDVQQVFTRLKRSLTFATDGDTLLSVPQVTRLETITLPDANDLAAFATSFSTQPMDPQILVDFGWANPKQRASVATSLQSLAAMDQDIPSVVDTDLLSGTASLFPEESSQHLMADTAFQPHPSSTTASASRSQYLFGGEGLELDFQLHDFGTPAAGGAPGSALGLGGAAEMSGSALGGGSGLSAGGTGDFFALADDSILERVRKDHAMVAEPPMDMSMDLSNDNNWFQQDLHPSQHTQNGSEDRRSLHESEVTQADQQAAVVQALGRQRAGKRQKQVHVICDEVTTLPLDEIRFHHESWEEFTELSGQVLTEKQAKALRQQVCDSLNAPLTQFLPLADWNYAAFQVAHVQPGLRIRRRGRGRGREEGLEVALNMDEHAEAYLPDATFELDPRPSVPGDFDNSAFLEPEVARAETVASESTNVPWKSFFDQYTTTGTGTGMEDGRSSLGGGPQNRSRLSAHAWDPMGSEDGTDTHVSRHSRRISAIDGGRLFGDLGGEEPGSEANRDRRSLRTSDVDTFYPDVFGDQLHGMMESGPGVFAELGLPEMVEHQNLERDTLDFLGYVAEKVQQQPGKTINFDQLLDGVEAQREVAAAAFYNILVLCTRGNMKPYQRRPYGEISMRLMAVENASA